MISALDFPSRGRCFEPGHCRRVVSLIDKKLYSIIYCLSKWVPRGGSNDGGQPCDELTSHPAGGVAIFPVPFCYRNRS